MPTDTTPDPRDMERLPEAQVIPEGPPGKHPLAGEAEIAQRPALPEHPEIMAADIEDEEDDPVVDSGAGIADGARGG